MAQEVTMPKLAMTQETGTILQWYKAEGDSIQIGEPLLEVMTNKVNIDVESYHEGILLKRLYEAGTEVPVLDTIAYIGHANELDSFFSDVPIPSQPPNIPKSTSNRKEEHIETTHISTSIVPKIRATPAARALARVHQIELIHVSGSGEHGRIHRDDIQAFLEKRTSNVQSSPSDRRNIDKIKSEINPTQNNSIVHLLNSDETLVKLSGMRKVIGQRMSQSAFCAPHVTLVLEVDMLGMNQFREQLNAHLNLQESQRISMNVFLLKATAVTLRKHPNVNATWHSDDELLEHRNVHLGMAVAVSKGLYVPVITDADRLGMVELSNESKRLAKEAREQTLSPDDLQGGTFTVSNLGMFGIEEFTPIINAPQVAILGVGKMIDKPVVWNGEITIRPQMKLSLSFDHRALDGAEAAEFLQDLKQTIEQPMLLLA